MGLPTLFLIENKTGRKMESKLLEERKKKIYDLMCNELYVPMKEKELAILLQIPKEQRPELKEVLEALLDEEKITISKRGKYSKAEEKKDLVSGVFESHPKGFGLGGSWPHHSCG